MMEFRNELHPFSIFLGIEETYEQKNLIINNHIQVWTFIFECLQINIRNQQPID